MPDYPVAITHALFAPAGGPSALDVALAESGDAAGGKITCPAQQWGVTEITLTSSGLTSVSQASHGHAPVPGGKAGRFFFAPKTDVVRISWKLKNPGIATTLTLELYRARSAAPIWTLTLDAAATQKQFRDWDDAMAAGTWLAPAEFPDGMITAEHSPYMLKATAGAGAEAGLIERWTYADVLIARIELIWGGKTMLPAGGRPDVAAAHRAKTESDESAINDALALRVRADGTLDPASTIDVNLPSNTFINWMYDFSENHEQRKSSLYLKHKAQWGDGIRIALKARIYLGKADGTGVHGGASAKAIGGLRLYWDWSSRDEIAQLGARGLKPAVQAFLAASLDFRRNDPAGPAASTNAHEDHGGKRGPTSQVFPDMTPPPGFPFTVSRCATRRWASYSRAILTGPEAGCTGVVFQPSRLAGDTYQVAVYAGLDGGNPETLDTLERPAQLRAKFADLVYAESGMFVINRLIRCRYVRKAPAVTSVVRASIAAEYAKCNVILDWGSAADMTADETRLHGNYDAYLQNVFQGNMPDETGAVANPQPHLGAEWNYHSGKLCAVSQFDGGTGVGTPYAVLAKDFDLLQHETKVQGIRNYVLKARKFNGPLRRYGAVKPALTAANDATWLLNFYAGLKGSKRGNADKKIKEVRDAVHLHDNRASYESAMAGIGVTATKYITQQLMIDVGEDSLVIFHCDAPVAYQRMDGTVVQPDPDTGGLSPSNAAMYGGRGGIHMVFLPEVPTTNATAKYFGVRATTVITHEMGHNLFLCHAPAAPGAAIAPGFVAALHDSADLLCLMNYDRNSDHLCGFCHLKLRGWGTATKARAAMDDGLAVLSNVAANNRV